MEAVVSNRRIRDKGRYLAKWIGSRDLKRQDMQRIIELLAPLIAELSREIAACDEKPSSDMRRRMKECSILLNTVVGATVWLGRIDRELLEKSGRTVSLAREGGEHATEVRALYMRGAILDRLGDTSEAVDTHRLAIRLGRQHGLEKEIVPSLLGMAAILPAPSVVGKPRNDGFRRNPRET